MVTITEHWSRMFHYDIVYNHLTFLSEDISIKFMLHFNHEGADSKKKKLFCAGDETR